MTINVNVPQEQLQDSDTEQSGTTCCESATGEACSGGKSNGTLMRVVSEDEASESEKEAAASPKEEENEKKKNVDQELIVIQENLYPIKILVPGIEPFEVQVSPQELVQELHQLLKDRESTCHRTCFKLQFNGVTMDNFCELKNIEGLKEGSEVKLVEEAYSVREARLHVRHIRDLLHSLDNVDAHNGSDCSSLCYVNLITDNDLSSDSNLANPSGVAQVQINSFSATQQQQQDNSGRSSPATNSQPQQQDDKSSRKQKQQQQQNSDVVDCTPPDYVMPGSKDRLITPLHPITDELVKMNTCIKVMGMSLWNPPPSGRRLHGDLLYLYVVTLEKKRFHITCNPKGFFVNQSDMDTFNPKAVQGAQVYHSLVELLNNLSPHFKKNFAILNKKRFNRHPFERIATPFQVNSWTAPQMDHEVDHVRAEDAFSSRLIVEEHLPGQNTRDWNEEISGTRELPRATLPERLIRERAMFKVHSDFVAAATRGAVLCVDGNVMAINPGDSKNMRMYIWNNIFFSLGFDVRDHYKDYGGHHAAFFAPNADLSGVRAYGQLDVEGLNVLGTAVVDYKGYRVTAQTIIPGILEREQEQSVVYGSIDFGKTIRTTDEFLELLSKTTKAMHIVPHSIKDVNGDSVHLQSSIECKGIHGNDKRHYILDLQKTFPPDVNFLPPTPYQYDPNNNRSLMADEKEQPVVEESEDNVARKTRYSNWSCELSPESAEMGFPHKHQHRLLTHRSELIDAFIEHKYHVFVCHCTSKIVAYRNAEKQKKEEGVEEQEAESESAGTSQLAVAKWQDEAVRSAARAVGSYKPDEFDIRFNPDIFSPGLNFDETDEEMEEQRRMIVDLATFLVKNQIPAFIKECSEHAISAVDGQSLTRSLHDKGIGVRYLGRIAPLLARNPALEHVHRTAVLEILLRSAKHVMRNFMQELDQISLSHALSHFLNCLLGHAAATQDEQSRRGKKKNARGKKKSEANGPSSSSLPWYKYTTEIVWEKIREEALAYFAYDLHDCSHMDDVVDKIAAQKISFLRRLCAVMGVQIQTRDYNLESSSKNKLIFSEEDIVRIYPIVKHAPPRASDASQFFASAQSKVQQGLIREAFELFSEALNLYTNVYGAVHVEIGACYRQLARLHYMMSEHNEAISSQLKAVILTERCLGVDHSLVISDLINLALYCFASHKISASLRLLYRARYLLLLSHGHDHPDVALVDSNIGLVMHGVQEYDFSLKFLDEALKINEKYHGETSHRAALSHHLLARAHSCKGEFRLALQHEKETFKLYKALYGEKHDKTRESAECLRHLTEQAVTLQRTMNEIYKSGSKTSFPPLQITAPSMQSVLDLMNIMNGIIFIPLSPKELEAIRKEVMKQQEYKQRLTNAAAASASSAAAVASANPAPAVTDGEKGNVEECETLDSKDSIVLPVNDSTTTQDEEEEEEAALD